MPIADWLSYPPPCKIAKQWKWIWTQAIIFAKCFQVWDAAIPNYFTEAREDDDLLMANIREYTKLCEEELKVLADKKVQGQDLYTVIQFSTTRAISEIVLESSL